ncbi:MAG: C1 family peptidase [Bacteroidia bacterium]|nr:C1 family peptidase [Bacteroidia bacterium]
MIKLSFFFALLFIATHILFAQENRGAGLLMDDEGYENIPIAQIPNPDETGRRTAPAVSLKNFSPLPKDQGKYNNCVGWATAYTARTIVEAQKEGWTNQAFITENAFSPGFVYKLISPDVSCYSPVSIDEAMKVMAQTGTVKFSDLKDACPGQIPSGLIRTAAQYKIKAYNRLFYLKDTPETKLESVRQSIANGIPVVIGFRCPPSFEKADGQAVWNPAESPSTTNYFGHAMCVIGYDERKYGGAFEIQNSWGTGWGDNGYIWVRYDDFAAFAKYAYILQQQNPRPETVAGSPSPSPTTEKPRTLTPETPLMDMAGRITFTDETGENMQLRLYGNFYRFRKIYQGGNRYKLKIEGKQGYVYVIGFDPNRQIYTIFPSQRDQSAQVGSQGKSISLPSSDNFYRMHTSLGEEYLCVLFSKKPLNIFNLTEQLERTPGSIFQRVEQVLGDQKLSAKDMSYFPTQAAFSGSSQEKSVAVVIVQLKRR